MNIKDFTQVQRSPRLRPLLLMLLVLLPGLGAFGDTFEYDGLTINTDGVEGTDYKMEDMSFCILSDKDFTFAATSTKVGIVVNEGVKKAHFTLSGYNCDRGEVSIGGPITIGKNSSVTITLAAGTTNTLKGETEAIMISDGASVTIDSKGSTAGGKLIANGHIGGAGSSITINGGEVESTMDLGCASDAASYSCIKLQGGKLSTPSVSMADNKVTINKTMTLTDNLTTSMPITVADGVVVSIDGDGSLNINPSNLTLGTDASITYLNKPTLNSDQYYEISTVGQMWWFASLVRGKLADGTEKNQSANGKLMADLDLNNVPWLPMADYSPWYEGPNQNYFGTFDGNHHTISNLNVQDGYSRGFFGRSWGTIKNLGVINATIKPGEGWVGVIAADMVHAAIINCWTAGDIVLADADKCEGVAGVANIDEFSTAKNCHTSYSAVAGRISWNHGGTDNCTEGISSDAYKTGELAYLLNKYKMEDETYSWGQTIGTDNHPVALEEGKNEVYQFGKVQEAMPLALGITPETNRMTTLCYPREVTLPEKVTAFTVTAMDGSDIKISKLDASVVPANTPVLLLNIGAAADTISLPCTNGIFSNETTAETIISQSGNMMTGTFSDITSLTETPYTLVNSTFLQSSETLPSAYQCYIEYPSGADAYTPVVIEYLEYPTKNSENCYDIYSVAQLKWFRDLVNGDLADGAQDESANAKLVTDIDLNNEEWIPIGRTGMYKSAEYKGHFDGNYHTVSNLNITNANNVICRGFFGFTINSNIENLGIVNAKIDDEGTVEAVGVVVAVANLDTIKGCWSSGDLELPTNVTRTAGIANTLGGCVNNCHTSYTDVVTGGLSTTTCTANVATDAYKTGVLAYLLNNYKESDETGWGQTIGTDEHPVALTEDNVVYGLYSGSSDFTAHNMKENLVIDTDNNQLAFANYAFETTPDNFVAKGKCQKFVLNDAVDVYSPSAFTATEVTYRRTFANADFNSLYLPFSACVDDFEDCDFFDVNVFHQYDLNNDGVPDAITLEVSKAPEGSILLANHPYFFRYNGNITDDATVFNLENVNVEATEDTIFEYSSASYKYEFVGSSQRKSQNDCADDYVLGADSETGKVSLVHPTEALPAMRWAMKMTARDAQPGSTSSFAPSKIAIIVTGEESATGISNVESDADSKAYYGIDGVRKSQMTKGLNIVKTADGRAVKVMKR